MCLQFMCLQLPCSPLACSREYPLPSSFALSLPSSFSSPPLAHASVPAQGGDAQGVARAGDRRLQQDGGGATGGNGQLRTVARGCTRGAAATITATASLNPPKIPGHAGSPVPHGGVQRTLNFLYLRKWRRTLDVFVLGEMAAPCVRSDFTINYSVTALNQMFAHLLSLALCSISKFLIESPSSSVSPPPKSLYEMLF